LKAYSRKSTLSPPNVTPPSPPRKSISLRRSAGEREALLRGFDAAQRWNDDENQPEFPTWEHFEQHLVEGEEHAVRLVRIAKAEESEEWPQDT
jgi:hypothetical protein